MSWFNVEERGNKSTSSWHFVVSETQKHHRGGPTLYKVTLQVIPVDISAQIQEVLWWKRYSDFVLIHKHLSALHAALFLKGTFPSFPKPTVFRKNDELVIEQRRQAADRLLNFISSYPILCRNDVFKEFLKGGQSVLHKSGCDPTEPLEPRRLYLDQIRNSTSSSPERLSLHDDQSSLPQSPNSECGIWAYRQRNDDEQESVCSGEVDLSPSSDEVPFSLPDHTICPISDYSTTLKPAPKLEEGSDSDATGSGAMSPTVTNTQRTSVNSEDYLFIAGHHLSRASAKESVGDFEVAFGMYKLGIDILLKGVQNDEDPIRRDAVRRKAAKYLIKAEKIYAEHINQSSADETETFVHLEYAAVAGSSSELAEYMVISILCDSVILVRHRTNHDTFIIKTLTKCAGRRTDRKTVVALGPQKHMVQLFRVIETEHSIHLILERAPGGNLWTYVKEYGTKSEGGTRSRLTSSKSESAVLSRQSSVDSTYQARKSTEMMPDSQRSDYGDLFLKYAARVGVGAEGDANRPRKSSLVQVEYSPSLPEEESDFVFDDVEDLFLANLSSSEVEHEFANSAHTSLFPTSGGLSEWKNVGEIDSDQLIAKSKELLQSVDRTIKVSEKVSIASSPISVDSKQSVSESNPVHVEKASTNSVVLTDCVSSELGTIVDRTHTDYCSVPEKRVPENLVRTWIAEIICGVEDLHDLGIICKTLSMKNILLGGKGHIKLTYFSQWNNVMTEMIPMDFLEASYYIAPEVRQGHASSSVVCDAWSIGIIMFEILAGQKFDIFNAGELDWHRTLTLPVGISGEAEDLIRKLLRCRPRDRITLAQAKQHPFFYTLNWKTI